MVGFFEDTKAQAGAADLIMFGLLVSISVVIMNVGPLTYENSQQLKAFENRYHYDYIDSSILTMKQVIVAKEKSGGSDIIYTIGPVSGAEGLVNEIAYLLTYIGFKEDQLPIRRTVKGTVLDWMADDVVINIKYDFLFDQPLSRHLVAKSFSEQSEKLVKKTLDEILGDKYNYFMIVQYKPSKNIQFINEHVYGVVTYTNYKAFEGIDGSPTEINKEVQQKLKSVRDLRVSDFPIAVSNDPDLILSLVKYQTDLFNNMMGSVQGAFSNLFALPELVSGGTLDNPMNSLESIKNEISSISAINTRAEVRLYAWPKA